MTGRFITFEGGDGAGKTSLIERLYETFRARGEPVLKTREPGDTPAGLEIRKLLLHHKDLDLTARCELLLYLADRTQHVEKVILPALERGEMILCDRFNDSTMAYQGAARGLEEAYLKKLCAFAALDLVPGLTLYLDIDPKIGLERLKQKNLSPDRIETEALSFHHKIREAYRHIASQEPKRFHLIDATLSPEEVFNQSLQRIDALLLTHR